MTTHAVLSASGSSRWLNCPGSVKASRNYENTTSSFAQEGTCAHELAAMVLQDEVNPNDYIGKTLKDAPEIEVDKEMVNYVEEYANYVNALPGVKLIEIKVDYSEWVPAWSYEDVDPQGNSRTVIVQGGFGTSDAIVIDEDAKIMHVVDLKYGKGVEVYAEDNSQGKLYGLGAFNDYEFEYDIDDSWEIVIHIYQPRIGNIDEWSISVKDLLAWAEAEVRPRALICMTNDAPRIAGTKQCTWCAHKVPCEELRAHIESTITSEFDNLDLPTVEEGLDFQNILGHKKLIGGWLKAIEGYVFEQLEKGTVMPGFKLVTGKSSRAWVDEAVTEKYMRKKRMKVGEMFNQKLISPPQAEKEVGKKKYADMVEEGLVITNAGKPTLANESDKRPAININVANDFDDLDDNLDEEF